MTETATVRRELITGKAKELLTGKSVGGENHRFLMSANEAHTVGEAISRRDYDGLNQVLGSAVRTMTDAYAETKIDTVQSTWERSLQQVTDLPGDTLEFINSSSHRERFIELLEQDCYGDELDIDPIAYVKMLETIVFATAPDVSTFKDRYYTAKDYRKSDTERALFSRTMLTLRTLTDQEPGIRNVREKLLDDDSSGFDEYLRRYSVMTLAREAYSSIAERFNEGKAAEARKFARDDLGALRSDEELMLTHLLSWTILPPEVSEKRDKRALKQAALDRAISDYQRKRLEEDWSDERIELIFDIARLGLDAGRNPNIYISSTFNNGAGLYLAVGLTHPQDVDKQIVVADNPVNGNALYFVDELNTEKPDGTYYPWHEVLGASKQIARQRGATRRYHTGNWVEVARAVCEYTGEHRKHETSIAENPVSPVDALRIESTSPALKRLEQAIRLAEIAMKRHR
jgi:hypothetical protein